MTAATRGHKPKNKIGQREAELQRQRELAPAPTSAQEPAPDTAMLGGPDGISVPLVQTDEVRTVVQDQWQPDRTNPEYADYGRAVLVQTVEGEVRQGTIHRTLKGLGGPVYEVDYGPLPEGAVGGPGHDIRRLSADDDMVFVDDLDGPATGGDMAATPEQLVLEQEREVEPADTGDTTSHERGDRDGWTGDDAEDAATVLEILMSPAPAQTPEPEQPLEPEQSVLTPEAAAALQDARMAHLRESVTNLLKANGGRIPSDHPELGALQDAGYERDHIKQALREVASYKKPEGSQTTGTWRLPGTPPPPPAALSDAAAIPAKHNVGDRRLTPDGMEHTVARVQGQFVASQCGLTFLALRELAKKGDCPNCSTDGTVKPTPPLEPPPPPASSGRAQRAGQASSAAVQTSGSTRGRGKATTTTQSAPAAPKATAQKPAAAPKANDATAGDYKVVPVEGGFVVQDGAGKQRPEVFPKAEDARWWGQRLTKLAKVKGDLYMPKVPNTTPEGYTIETAGEGASMTAWLSQDGKRLPPTFTTGTNCRVDAMRYSQRLGRPGRAG